MKKLSLVVATLIASQSVMADDTTNDWSLSGNIRAAYISDDGDKYKGNTAGVSNDFSEELKDLTVGGWVTLTTPSVKGFTVTGTVYTSQPLMNLNTDAWLTEVDGSSYSYIGEAYITGTVFGKTAIVLGKKVIDTPFADSDDIGMSPNSFEVALVQNSDIENVTLLGGRVTKQAGMDAPRRGEFSDLTGGDGASVLAGIYNNGDIGLSAQAWYYHLDNAAVTPDKSTGVGVNTDAGLIYADATYSTAINEASSVSISGQYANFQHINGDENDGSVVGGSIELGYDALTLGVAFNQASGDIPALDGFGGGPYYTSADLLTLNSAGLDSSAMRVSASYSITDQVSVSGGYLTMTPDKGDDLTETDFAISYAYNDNLSFDLYAEVWSDYIRDGNGNTLSYNETLDYTEYSLFMNYSF